MVVVLFHATTAEHAALLLRYGFSGGEGNDAGDQPSGGLRISDRLLDADQGVTGGTVLAIVIDDLSTINEFAIQGGQNGHHWLVPASLIRQVANVRHATVDDIVRALTGEPVVVTGTVVAIDDGKMTIDAGQTFALPPSANLADLAVGTKVTLIERGEPPSASSRPNLFAVMIHKSGDDVPGFALLAEDKVKLARRRRAKRIERFIEEQHDLRQFIRFAEIASWRAELGGSAVPDEDARALGYDQLVEDLLEGDFEEDDKSRVLYLHPWSRRARMTRKWLRQVKEVYSDYPAIIRSEYLDHCWLPKRMFRRHAAKHSLPQSPPRFAPSSKPPVSKGTAGDETKAIKFLAAHLDESDLLRRADAKALCANAGFKFSDRGFQYRIWPKARENAQLSPKKRPGPPPRSSR